MSCSGVAIVCSLENKIASGLLGFPVWFNDVDICKRSDKIIQRVEQCWSKIVEDCSKSGEYSYIIYGSSMST